MLKKPTHAFNAISFSHTHEEHARPSQDIAKNMHDHLRIRISHASNIIPHVSSFPLKFFMSHPPK